MTADAPDTLDPEMYPDLVGAGGLAPALRAAADRAGADLGDMSTSRWENPFTTVHLSSTRGSIGVRAEPSTRRFDVGMATRGHNWAYGSTTDLDQVVGAIHAWREGARLRELAARFPFMTFDRMAQAWEDGNPVDVMWEMRLQEPELEEIRPVLRAAHAHPPLRALFSIGVTQHPRPVLVRVTGPGGGRGAHLEVPGRQVPGRRELGRNRADDRHGGRGGAVGGIPAAAGKLAGAHGDRLAGGLPRRTAR